MCSVIVHVENGESSVYRWDGSRYNMVGIENSRSTDVENCKIDRVLWVGRCECVCVKMNFGTWLPLLLLPLNAPQRRCQPLVYPFKSFFSRLHSVACEIGLMCTEYGVEVSYTRAYVRTSCIMRAANWFIYNYITFALHQKY